MGNNDVGEQLEVAIAENARLEEQTRNWMTTIDRLSGERDTLRAELEQLRQRLTTEHTVNVMRSDWEAMKTELESLRRLHEEATERSAELRTTLEQAEERIMWAIHDAGLPRGEHNLEIRVILTRAALAALKGDPL